MASMLAIEAEAINRYWTHLRRDLSSITLLATVRLAHLASHLKELCSAAVLRARNHTIGLRDMQAVRHILERTLDITAALSSRHVVRLFLDRGDIARQMRNVNQLVRQSSFSVAPGMRLYTRSDEALDGQLDMRRFDQVLITYTRNPVLMQRIVATIRPQEIRILHTGFRELLNDRNIVTLGPVGHAFDIRAVRAIELRLTGTGSPYLSPHLAGSPMPPTWSMRARLASNTPLPAIPEVRVPLSSPSASVPAIRSRAYSAAPSPAFLRSAPRPRTDSGQFGLSPFAGPSMRTSPHRAAHGMPVPASAPLQSMASPSGSLHYENHAYTHDPLLFEMASPSMGPRLDVPGPNGSRSPSPSQLFPQRLGQGVNTIIRYYDSMRLSYIDWKPFRAWFWKVPDSVQRVVDWDSEIISVENTVTVIAAFSALDETLARGVIDRVCPASQAPPMLFKAKPGDRLRVIQIFSVRTTPWLACIPLSNGVQEGLTPSPAASPTREPGFIPLKSVVLNPTSSGTVAHPARYAVPLHSSARAFEAKFRFRNAQAEWREYPVIGIVHVTQISYHAASGSQTQAHTALNWYHFPFSRIMDVTPGADAENVLTLREDHQDRAIHVLFANELQAVYFLEDVLRMRRLSAGRE